jgi:hypothetical protein
VWINSQIGGKNMTGKLQTHIPQQFFLSLIRPVFDEHHSFFKQYLKWFTGNNLQRKETCEYHKKLYTIASLFV